MSKSEQTGRVCPKCGRRYTDPPALSRADNATNICPDCGMMEALASIPQAAGGVCRLTIVLQVGSPPGQAIGVKEDIAMRLESLGNVRVVSITEDTPEQLRIADYVGAQGQLRR